MEENLPVLLCFTLYLRAISKYKPPWGLYLEGRFNGGFFALQVWGAYIWRGLYKEGIRNSEFYGILRDFIGTSATRSTSTRSILINAKVSVKDCIRNLVTTAYNTKVEKQMRKGV